MGKQLVSLVLVAIVLGLANANGDFLKGGRGFGRNLNRNSGTQRDLTSYTDSYTQQLPTLTQDLSRDETLIDTPVAVPIPTRPRTRGQKLNRDERPIVMPTTTVAPITLPVLPKHTAKLKPQRTFVQQQTLFRDEQSELPVELPVATDDSVSLISPAPTTPFVAPYGGQPKTTFDEAKDKFQSCSDNPCLNEATCENGKLGGFRCVCPWGWTGRFCEICTTECASSPCPMNKKCRAKYGGGFDCICPADRTGPNCEIQNDACSISPCLNGGICKPDANGLPTCVCTAPFAGRNCEAKWTTPCTEEILRSLDVIQFIYPWDDKKFIVCTDVNLWSVMDCSPNTRFNEKLGHCIPDGYEAPEKDSGSCLNGGEQLIDEEGYASCICKAGYTGDLCEVDIDECQLSRNACGTGMCVDQVNTFYCEYQDGSIGLDTTSRIDVPCTEENIRKGSLYFGIGTDGFHYIHCEDVGVFTVRKCAGGLFWNQEENTCTMEREKPKTGICLTFPCKNAGQCLTNDDGSFRCVCKEGYTGDLCEEKIDYCASNPCMNGGRCLSYPGGYTCVCPDKLIDECCCNGIMNPCPLKPVPGLNSYFPHLFPHRYIHCDFDGRAFVRTCAPSTRWVQAVFSCLPEGFNLTQPEETTTALPPQRDLPVAPKGYDQPARKTVQYGTTTTTTLKPQRDQLNIRKVGGFEGLKKSVFLATSQRDQLMRDEFAVKRPNPVAVTTTTTALPVVPQSYESSDSSSDDSMIGDDDFEFEEELPTQEVSYGQVAKPIGGRMSILERTAPVAQAPTRVSNPVVVSQPKHTAHERILTSQQTRGRVRV